MTDPACAGSIPRALSQPVDWHDLAGAVEKIGAPTVKAPPKRRKPSAKSKAKSTPPAPRQHYRAQTRLWADLNVDERLELLRTLIRSGRLTTWEVELCTDIGITLRDHPRLKQSDKQQAVLDRLAAKHREHGGRW